MDSILRGLSIYFFLLIVVRLSGRRTLGEMSAFDFVLLLMIGEATQQGLLGEDFSIINAFLVIGTLVGADVAMSFAKQKFKRLDQILEGVPSVLIEDGKIFVDRMNKARVDKSDIMEAARIQLGLAQLSQVRHAVLEKSGSISIVPWIGEEAKNETRNEARYEGSTSPRDSLRAEKARDIGRNPLSPSPQPQ